MRLIIELQAPPAGSVTGTLLAGGDAAVGFDGWLGLLRALEDAIDAQRGAAETS